MANKQSDYFRKNRQKCVSSKEKVYNEDKVSYIWLNNNGLSLKEADAEGNNDVENNETDSSVENFEDAPIFENDEKDKSENEIIPLKQRLRSSKTANSLTVQEGHAFVTQIEPNDYESALQSKDSTKWVKAMDEEIKALEDNNTWSLVDLPMGRKVVDNRWVYKIKAANANEKERYKARLVARGFTQEYGFDYEETFSPVAKFTSIRTILAVAATEKLILKQFDVKTAFLYGELKEDIYMCQPKGYEDGSKKVCKLNKSLYGLKQSSRCWNKTFTNMLSEFKFKMSTADPCVFISHQGEKKMILAIYIDDGLVAATDNSDISDLLEHLKQSFEIKEFDAKSFLGFEINILKDNSIHLSQTSYIEKVLKRFNMNESKPVTTPIDNSTSKTDDNLINTTKFPYRQAVGSLIYLAIGTRPDISFAVGVASRYLDSYLPVHITAVKKIMRYIGGTRNFGILFNSNNKISLSIYSDADYAGDVESRKSTSGFISMACCSPVSWYSQRQQCVALSTTESEYVAASQASKELVWLKQLLQEFFPSADIHTTLFVDNQSAIRLIKNAEFHKRSKHIEVRYHFIRSKYNEGCFDLQYIPSEKQLADIFTKALSKDKFQKLRDMICVVPYGSLTE